MKANLKYLAMAVIASMTVAFTSCSNDDESGNDEKQPTKSLFLKIKNQSTASYSESAPVTAGTPVVFNSGDLYFVNSGGAILQHYTITTAATDLAGSNINLTDIQTGCTITNVPGGATDVHIVANTAILPTPGNISAVKATLVQVESQSSSSAVNLYGTNVISAPASVGNPYTCSVTVKPTVARLEIDKIQAGGVITGYVVEGIFIDNYYSQGAVGNDISASDLKNNPPTATAFNDNSTEYPSKLKPAIYDFNSSGLGTLNTNVTTPTTAGQVWGYNLITGLGTTNAAAVPRIILRLKSVTTNDGSTYSDPQFVTIKGLKSSGTALTSIQAGKVYKISGGITFDETNLASVPNLSSIDVTVTVTLAEWTVVTVTPDL